MKAHLWIFCTPETRDAVNGALGQADARWAGTMAASLPRPTMPFGPKPAPRIYWAGWQDDRASLLVAMAAIRNIAGVKTSFGSARGIDLPSSAEADHTKGNANTKYTFGAALKSAELAFGVTSDAVSAKQPAKVTKEK